MKINPIKLLFISALFSLPFSASAELVNINDASAAAMSHYLKGIGDVKAASIVEYRERNGDFESVADLVNVKGIGNGLLKKNRKDLSLTEGVVKWIKAKPKLVEINAKDQVKNRIKKSKSKKIALKNVSKPITKKVVEKTSTDLKASNPSKKKIIPMMPR